MLQIGRINLLTIDTLDQNSAHFKTLQGEVLLPAEEIPPGTEVGTSMNVFIYQGGNGTLRATLRTPLGQINEFALLKVVQTSKVGAFLDWGLDKDLLVPFSEQTEQMQLGRRYLVRIGLDHRGRIVGTARIDSCLKTDPTDLKVGDEVDLRIWQHTELGAKVIVNNLYGGLLYRDELTGGMQRGRRRTGFIKRIREDGKIDVTLRRTGVEGIKDAQQIIMTSLYENEQLPLTDDSPPEIIRERLGMSKKTFKRAVGGLYKAGLIDLVETGIRQRKSATESPDSH